VLLVHKQPANRAGPGVDVLVIAPHGKVDLPRVQAQLNVPDRVRQVPRDGGDAARARVRRDGRHVEQLARVVLDARQKDERRLGRVPVNHRQDVRRAHRLRR
jgi:hypothetical protein